jgi:glycosyltransferase involved in cell wall biosynthesis
MRVTHIITDLDTGGAEMMLYKLLASLHNQSIDFSVISLVKCGAITNRIEELGVKVETLNLKQGEYPSWKAIKRLRQLMQSLNPDIVQGWMYHGNIAATIAVFLHQPLRRKTKLFWNVRQTLYKIQNEKRKTQWIIRLSCWLSFFPKNIVYNSTVSMKQHGRVGFSKQKKRIIPNGFNLKKFRPDLKHRQQFCKEFKVSKDTLLIGHVSRLHPMKDHATLLRAIDRVMDGLSKLGSQRKVLFLLVGHGVTSDLSNNPAIRFLGERSDIPKIMSVLDILVSSSAWGEGFPNVIGEAMASEVPCVVTDVGDSASIVGKYGRVCSVGDDQCIAFSILQLISNPKERKIMGQQARKRIKDNYSINNIKQEYLMEWGFE